TKSFARLDRDRDRAGCARSALRCVRRRAGALSLRRAGSRRRTRAPVVRAVRAARVLRARGRVGARSARRVGRERARARPHQARPPAVGRGLIALELAVAVSALERLRLYRHEYGLTELRLY